MSGTRSSKHKPKYPIYIPSKGRADLPLTARMFERDNVPFYMVVQPDQVEAYKEWDERGCLLVLPEDDKGLVYARNWIKDHSRDVVGAERHWQFDDDVRYLSTVQSGYRIRIDAGLALAMCEAFVDRYENVALASLNSEFFVVCNGVRQSSYPPFYLNSRCYTNFLHLNSLPNRWRYRYNEDTDMSLQVLADGWCTILFNAFLMGTQGTEDNSTGKGKDAGGQAAVYDGDGRLKMARELERVWPGVVETKRRFGRPQHVVKGAWTKFDTPLKLKPDAGPIPDFGVVMRQVAEQIKSPELQRLLEERSR